jgi:Cys-tRNA(Pro)/Cys-tRNA(Cys) deacylase
MAKSTPATLALKAAGVSFEVHEYDYDPGDQRVGLQAAEALGADPGRVLKTLMTEVDGKPVCVVLASDREVAMKKLAAAAGGRSAKLMAVADAERVTGYKVGGVSAFGRKRPSPVVVDAGALAHGKVFVNAGRRGLQAELKPQDLVEALGATVAEVTG